MCCFKFDVIYNSSWFFYYCRKTNASTANGTYHGTWYAVELDFTVYVYVTRHE